MQFIVLLIFHSCLHASEGKFESKIIGGSYAEIKKYPHSVFININCDEKYICGGSVLTNRIILSAAHCFSDCAGVKKEILIGVGNEDIDRTICRIIRKLKIHEDFDEDTMANDIAIGLMNMPLVLNNLVKRVVLAKVRPKENTAFVAGWGVVNGYNTQTKKLKHLQQTIHTRKTCLDYINRMPLGSMCAGDVVGADQAARGDSGGALVVNGYNQIGIVSYRLRQYSLAVYTDVTHYYNWIVYNAMKLSCM